MLLLLTILQFIAGFGVATLFKISQKPALFLPLCLLVGIAVFSIVPFAMQLMFIPLSSFNIFLALVLVSAMLNIRYRAGMAELGKMLKGGRFTMRLYEVPFLLVIAVIVLISVWRCFYLPPTPRDLTSGAEVIAEYAVKEKTMVNSVFSVNLETTNNQFKPPFITCLQIIYKLAGFPFGQIWLSAVFISFIIFLYHSLNATLHRVISGLLIIAFLAIPEMYAYTFMVLFDYCNAVFFFLAIYFLTAFFANGQINYLAFAAVMMGIATYIRNETLILAVLVSPALFVNRLKGKRNIKAIMRDGMLFLAPAAVFYMLCVTLYLNHYLPVKYDVGNLVNRHLLTLKPLVVRFWQMNKSLIFSADGVGYYSYFIFFFCALFVPELIYERNFNLQGRNWLYAILVIYIGLPLLGFLLPLMDIDNSTKRGLFKIFPLMLLYMANNKMLTTLSARITAWENLQPASEVG
jgi:hypothetical protein